MAGTADAEGRAMSMELVTISFDCPCCGYTGLAHPPYRELAGASVGAGGLKPP